MESKEAIKLARLEFEKDFKDGEETNQWLTSVIEGLKQAEKDLEKLKYYKAIVSVLLYKNDSITKIKYFKNGITRRIHLYIHFEGNEYFCTTLPYEDFKEYLENDKKM